MKKKLLSTLVVLVAVVAQAWMATSARAATNYGISIGSVAITSDNYQNLAGIVPGGIVTFDPQTATLTLNNVVFNMAGNGISVNSSYFSRIKIKLMGTNYIAGLYYGLQVNTGVTLVIEGPGSLTFGASTNGFPTVSVYNDSYLTLHDTSFKAYSITGYNSPSGTSPYREMTVVNSTVEVTTKIQGLTYLTNVLSRFENTNVGFQNGKVVNLTTGAEVSGVKIMATPDGDFDGNGKLNLSDAQYIIDYQTGFQTDDNPSRMDISQDGYVNAADITMLYNYIGGTRSPRSSSFLLMHELEGDEYTFGNLDRNILFSGSSITQKWVWTDLFLGDVIDTNSAHFYCFSNNSDVVSASIATGKVYGNISTKVFNLVIKKKGRATITFRYDDGTGNTVEAKAKFFVYSQSDVLASNDKIFGARPNGGIVESFDLNMNSNVPVGTTMMLTIDKDATYSYDNTTRNERMNCTTWEVSGNSDVTLAKTDQGYVIVYVGAAGEFSVTATDPRGNERTATFVAKDVYTYDQHSVYKNNNVIFCVPPAKTSQIFGTATKVEIKKMIINNGEVWTLVNHYRFAIDERTELFGSLMTGQYYDHDQTYEVPITTQIFRNGTLFYEKENTFFEDLAVNSNTVCGVGSTYNPDIDYYDWGYDYLDYTLCGWDWYPSWENVMSKRLSMFYVTLDKATQSVNYSMVNPGQAEGESNFRNVIFDPTTNDILMFGYYKSRHSYTIFTKRANCFQRNWAFWRLNQYGNQSKEFHYRDENDHYTYMPYAIAMAKGKPRGATRLQYFETNKLEWIEGAPGYMFKYKSDIVISDFSKTNGSGTVDIGEEYRPRGSDLFWLYRQTIDGGITSSWHNGSLYGWKDNKVFKFADDCESFDTFRTYVGLGKIIQLKVQNNTGVSGVEEFFVLAKKGKGMALNSMFGDVDIANPSLIGFDFK